MPTNRLSRSIPFWVLVGGSAVATIGGVYLLISKLGAMDSALTDNTATTSDVYVGQIWAVAGAILAGIGLIGLALALAVGALSSIARRSGDVVEVVEPPAWEEDVVEVVETAPSESPYAAAPAEPVAEPAEPVAPASEPVAADPATHDEPLIATGDEKPEAPRA